MDSIRQSHFQAKLTRAESKGSEKAQQDAGAEQEQEQPSFADDFVPSDELGEDEEQEEGERHEAELLEKYDLWEDEETELLFDDIFESLEIHMKRPGLEYEFVALDSDVPFASSCPNGAIYFTRSLIEHLDPNEVLYFAAHELAHTELKHYATRQRRLHELRQLISAPAGSGSRQRLTMAAVLCVRHQEEFEADHQACQWLDPSLGARALTHLHELCKEISPKSLNRPTHPPFERRLQAIKEGSSFPEPLTYLYSLIAG